MHQPLPLAEEHPFAADRDADHKLQAISALLAYPSYREAAEAAAVDRDVLSRWLKDPPFQRALASARRDLQHQAFDAFHAASATVMDLFLSTSQDPQAPAPTRTRAAQAILTLSHRARQSALHSRLAALQHACHPSQSSPSPVSSTA